MTSRKNLVPAWQKWIYTITILMMVISGFGQMPLFKRYYVADLPGMAWTADFFVTHKLHYLFAAMFLALALYWVTRYLAEWRRTHVLTSLGAIRVGIYAGIALSGMIRTPGNLHGWHWSPALTMSLDLGHLALVMTLGAAAFISILSSTGYLEPQEARAKRKADKEREKRRQQKEAEVRARGVKPKTGCAPSG